MPSPPSRLVVAIGLPLPGSRDDCLAFTESGVDRACRGTPTIADGGYQGTGLLIPHRKRRGQAHLSPEQEAENAVHRRARARVEHALSRLKNWGELPLIEGILIRLEVEHLSKGRAAPAEWPWSSKTGADGADVDRAWQAFLRRFDLEHTFRLFKQMSGWTRPRLRGKTVRREKTLIALQRLKGQRTSSEAVFRTGDL